VRRLMTFGSEGELTTGARIRGRNLKSGASPRVGVRGDGTCEAPEAARTGHLRGRRSQSGKRAIWSPS